MQRCSKCEKYYPMDCLEGIEGHLQCFRCENPHMDFSDDIKGLDDPPPPWIDLLGKMTVRMTRMEIILPMMGDPSKEYVEAVVYEGEGRYWFVEGSSMKYKSKEDAISAIAVLVDAKRTKMLNDEFEKEFG